MQIEENLQEKESELPTYLKLELRTPLEVFFRGSTVLSVIFLLITTFIYWNEGMGPIIRIMFFCATVSTIFFGLLYRNTDNYYILDIPSQVLLYHFKFFIIKKVRVMARFSEINAVTVSGKFVKTKNDSWWEYYTLMADMEGRATILSDSEKEAFQKNAELAEKLAEITGAEYIKGRCNRVAKVVRSDSGRHTFTHNDYSWMDDAANTIMFLCGIAAFIVCITLLKNYSVQIVEFFKIIFGN